MINPTVVQQEVYPYLLYLGGRERILFWVDGGKKRDYFLKNSVDQLLIGDSIEKMRFAIDFAEGTIVRWDEPGQMDLDEFWRKIRGLRVGRASSQETCKTILSGWNFFEDLSETLSISKDLPVFTSELVQNVYKKIFSGCNLPAMTPKNKGYQPIWRTEELMEFRAAMRDLWKCIVNSAPNLIG